MPRPPRPRPSSGLSSAMRYECKLRPENPVLTFRARAAVLLVVFNVLSVSAAAQKDAFRDALIGFHSKLSGDYGDEGSLVAANLETMSSALAVWDGTIRSAEENLRTR